MSTNSIVYLTDEQERKIITALESRLFSSNSVPEAISYLAQDILQMNDFILKEEFANVLITYRDLIVKRNFLKNFRKTFNKVYDMIFKEFGIQCQLIGRRKSVISTVEKLLKLAKTNSLEKFMDAYGIRIILLTPVDSESEIDNIEMLYKITNRTIEYLISDCSYILETGTSLPKREELDAGVNIIVPHESKIKEAYKSKVKDYVVNPKHTGYQSHQAVLRNMEDGSFIEIQLRTLRMHVHAEYKEANHDSYKDDRYLGESIGQIIDKQPVENDRLINKINLKKITIPGFVYLGSPIKEYFDGIGIADSVQIYYRTLSYAPKSILEFLKTFVLKTFK